MMRKLVSLFPFAVLLTFSEVTGEENCDKLGILIYEEIGCKAIKTKPDDLCPSSYDCNHLQQIEEDYCHYQGLKYKNKEALAENATYGTCNAGCFCNPDVNGPKFTCAAFDCAPILRQQDPECVDTYHLSSCCGIGQICPPFNNISICKVEGHTYKEGEKFHPKGTCKTCICQKDFTGKYEEPFCIRQNCVAELQHSGDMKKNCAPVYKDKNLPCCPSLWVCPEESDIFSPAKKSDSSGQTCKFGEKEIKSGQILQKSIVEYSTKYEIKCQCQLPPLLTCIIEKTENVKN